MSSISLSTLGEVGSVVLEDPEQLQGFLVGKVKEKIILMLIKTVRKTFFRAIAK